jgi:type II secretory pathway pseudopilin PulG
MRRRLSHEAGFTVIELLMAMTIGIVVLGAAMVLVSRATSLTTTTQNRVDAHQRGRAALESIVSELRSGVCAVPTTGDPQPPLISGTGTRVEFYANTAGANAQPQRRVLRYDAVTHTIWEDVFQGQSPATDPTGKTGQTVLPIPDTARVGVARRVLANVYPPDAGRPIFTYWSYGLYQTVAPPNAAYKVADKPYEVQPPIQAAADVRRVSEIQVAIRVRPDGIASTDNNPLDAILKGAAFARSADPATATTAPGTVIALLDANRQPVSDRVAGVLRQIYVGQPISCQ